MIQKYKLYIYLKKNCTRGYDSTRLDSIDCAQVCANADRSPVRSIKKKKGGDRGIGTNPGGGGSENVSA